ncbi:1042_t:CDS:2 [Funneliformis geosporum]|uniref:1042_t:CDS:1 n=1 Tax=Funneliformis geosporum TaxID=1117311 RepID=A0A9W4WUM7_9GLOM|nr:1042_t:CDS:2 [Funneliformis geosporum]
MSVLLKDLNDYIAPSQACIKPVEVNKTSTDSKSNVIKVDNSGGYYEVSREGVETKLQTASITLDDCLACSGCITSAESILITMQSQEELYNILKSNKEAIEQNKADQVKTVVVSIAPQSVVSIAAKYNLTPLQVAKRLTYFFKTLGVHHVFDTSFSRDFSLLESAREFVERYRVYQEKQQQFTVDNDVKSTKAKRNVTSGERDHAMNDAKLPMLASACPGWICYAEKTHGSILPYISQTKSPQQIMGSVVKDYLGNKLGIKPDKIYHVGVMMCYDKKLEASRNDFFNQDYQTRDVDCVITSGEVVKMFEESHFDIMTSEETSLDIFTKTSQQGELLRSSGSASGGYLEFILEYAARELFKVTDVDVDGERGVMVKTGRNKDFKEVTLEINGKPVLRFASAYGFRNIQNLVRKIKNSNSPYHYVEVMACPSGCINGGGQLKPNENIPIKDWILHVNNIYRKVNSVSPEKNDVVLTLYNEWLDGIDSEKSKSLLRTQYHAVETSLTNPLAVKW